MPHYTAARGQVGVKPAPQTMSRGLILFRPTVRSTNYGDQARLLTQFWFNEDRGWDWMNRIVYLPR